MRHVPQADPTAPPKPERPRLRGLVHLAAFVFSVPVGAALVAAAATACAARALGIYAAAVSIMLGVSALYHRVTWSPGRRRWMRRVDHSTVFLVLAGSYTPWALLVLEGPTSDVILVAMWVGAAVGAAVNIAWIEAPKPVVAATYVVVGLLALVVLPDWLMALGLAWTALVAFAGALSAVGALAYASGRPNPWPGVFGYHEVFHTLVVAALAVHTLAIALYALP